MRCAVVPRKNQERFIPSVEARESEIVRACLEPTAAEKENQPSRFVKSSNLLFAPLKTAPQKTQVSERQK